MDRHSAPFITGFRVIREYSYPAATSKLKMCRKVELFNKRMVLGVIVTQIVPQMMQLKKFYHHQIEVNPFGYRNLRSV